MSEYIERKALYKALTTAAVNDKFKSIGTWAKAICVLHDLPAADVEKMSDGYHTFADLYEQRLILSAALAKIIRMHGKASGMRTAAFLSAGDGSSWVLTPTKDVTHTTMS